MGPRQVITPNQTPTRILSVAPLREGLHQSLVLAACVLPLAQPEEEIPCGIERRLERGRMRVNGLNLRKSRKGAARVVCSGASLYPQGQPLRVQSGAGKADRERFDRLSVTPQTEQATRPAQLPLIRVGAGRPGREQHFVALQGLLKQGCIEEQFYACGFDFLRGLGELVAQSGTETPESLARLLRLGGRGKRKIHLLECPRRL